RGPLPPRPRHAVCRDGSAGAGPCRVVDGDHPLSSHGDDLLAASDGGGSGAGGRVMTMGSAIRPHHVTLRPMPSRHTAETSHPTALAPTCSSRRHRDAIRSVSASVDARHTARNGTPSLSLVSPCPPGAWRWRHDHPYHPVSRLSACDPPRCRTALRCLCPRTP